MFATRWSVVFPSVLLCAACSSSSEGTSGPTEQAVVSGYAELVHETYEASVDGAKTLQRAVHAFTDNPTAASLEAAKTAWVEARKPYLQSEAFRFYGGPIDAEGTDTSEPGPEARINGWPLDEFYIDYVAGMPDAGIINMKSGSAFLVPEITREAIASKNEAGGEKNLSAGWHAIEFLLWGQDFDAAGPGKRPYTDFVSGTAGTASNQDRRRTYLRLVTDLLVDDLVYVEGQWETGVPGTYGAQFVKADPKAKLADILKGIGSLAGAELPKERMSVAYDTKEQEEEHSCFSDTTPQDMVLNGQGVENVYLGKFGSWSGVGLSALVARLAPELDSKMRSDLARAVDASRAIPAPFDQAILGSDSAPGRVKLRAAIDAWTPVKDDVVAIAKVLGVVINFE